MLGIMGQAKLTTTNHTKAVIHLKKDVYMVGLEWSLLLQTPSGKNN